MAAGWLALELSDNPFLVGLVSSVGAFPILLLSLHAGVLVDRTDKLRLVTVAQALLLLEASLLWWLTWTGHVTVGALIALSAFAGIVNAVEIPARQSLIVDLVGREDLHEAIALNSSGFNLARIVGPSIAAVVIARFGIAWCFGVNALSYLFVLGGLLQVRIPAHTPAARTGSALGAVRQALGYVAGTRPVAVLMGLITVNSVFGVPYLTLMPVVARDRLGVGAAGYGVLLACVGIGGLTGALFLAAVGARLRRAALLAAASVAFPALLLVFSVARNPTVAAGLLLLIGFSMILNNALANGILQAVVPDALRGRMMALYSFVVVGLSQVVGAFAAGAVARAVGEAWAIGGGAALMLAYTGIVYSRYPEMRRLGEPAPAAASG
jgi:MFS family permease